MVEPWERLWLGLERALNTGVPSRPNSGVARSPSRAPLIGAVVVAMDAVQAGANIDGAAVTVSAATLGEGQPS